MSSMDELIEYLSGYVPTPEKQVVVLVDDDLPGFNEKMLVAKEVFSR